MTIVGILAKLYHSKYLTEKRVVKCNRHCHTIWRRAESKDFFGAELGENTLVEFFENAGALLLGKPTVLFEAKWSKLPT